MATPCSAALALILSPAPFISFAAAGHSPVSAAVRSSDGTGGQSGRSQEAPFASLRTSVSLSPSERKKAAQL